MIIDDPATSSPVVRIGQKKAKAKMILTTDRRMTVEGECYYYWWLLLLDIIG